METKETLHSHWNSSLQRVSLSTAPFPSRKQAVSLQRVQDNQTKHAISRNISPARHSTQTKIDLFALSQRAFETSYRIRSAAIEKYKEQSGKNEERFYKWQTRYQHMSRPNTSTAISTYDSGTLEQIRAKRRFDEAHHKPLTKPKLPPESKTSLHSRPRVYYWG